MNRITTKITPVIIAAALLALVGVLVASQKDNHSENTRLLPQRLTVVKFESSISERAQAIMESQSLWRNALMKK